MSETTMFATIGAIGFGFVTWYFWGHGSETKKKTDVKLEVSKEVTEEERVVSKASKEETLTVRERVKATKEETMVKKEAVKVTAELEEERRERVKVTMEKESSRKELLKALKDEESTQRVHVSQVLEETSVQVEPPAEKQKEEEVEELALPADLVVPDDLQISGDLSLDGLAAPKDTSFGELDLGGALEGLASLPAQESPAAKAEEEMFVMPAGRKGNKKKGGARPSMMAIFDAPAPEESTTAAAAATQEESAMAEEEPTQGGLDFEFGVAADINLKGLKKAKKVMTHGKGKSRYEMQDTNICVRPFVDDSAALFCVFDGHAGKVCASKCIEYYPGILRRHLPESLAELQDARTALMDSFAELDKKLLKYEDEGATATVVLTWVTNGVRRVQSANVGDSSAFLRHEQRALELTVDHKVTTPSERARVEALGIELGERATRIPGGLAVSRAIGDHFLKSQLTGLIGEPHVSEPLELTPQDSHLVLSSDALWDMISLQEAADKLTPGKGAEDLAQSLLLTALKSTDNATCVVLKFF